MMENLSEKLAYLRAEIADKEAANEELKRQIAENLEEIESISKVADSYEVVLAYEKGALPLPDSPIAKDDISIVSDSQNGYLVPPKMMQSKVSRKPSEILKPQFRGVMQKESVLVLMQKKPTKKFLTSEFMEEMFEPDNKTEEQAVRAAIGSVLSRGVKDGSWKGGKGIYYLEEEVDAGNH
ncbi:MAG: hypothetical protein ACFB14_00220 [Leptolyngbyaceae cyanobacterium]